MKFRKKPLVVDAYQINSEFFIMDAPDWVVEACHLGMIFAYPENYGVGVMIDVPEGEIYMPYGHWLIKGSEGEFYTCEPTIFNKYYEEVAE